ncbi:hypothetical protein SNE40_019798 [Patella caerulea]|uniref:Tesmin/TSO1-like CXC domain-containing protein n=1 Tax=Patella caerulea TaxID=87958 RepID=A0AAN8IXX3_PATCE
MPPTSDALNQHLLRANYQACIHKRSLCQWMQMPSPNNHGWTVHNNELDIVWMTNDPVPKSLLDVVHCSCKTGCNSGRCVCLKGKVSCTDLCKCFTCKNVLSVETDGIDIHIESDDESDDEYILL